MKITKKINKELPVKQKKKNFKRLLKYIVILLFILLILNVVPSFFYRVEKNDNPLPYNYRKGVYHMHSIHSDGKGTVDEITRAASQLGLDFVILTDHGRPNIGSATSTSWSNQVLLIGGSELSLNCGHLAAMGFKVPRYIFPPEPQEAINEIVNYNENGICFVAHPFDDKVPWTDWDINGYTGLEILSSYSEARRAGILKILVFPLKYLINSKYALLNTMNYPKQNIMKWDSLNEIGKYYGIYALDAHAKLPISKSIQLNFPTYKSMFEIMTIYVKTKQSPVTDPKQAASQILTSIKKGNFFNVIEGIAPANGFEAFYTEKISGKKIDMGGYSNSVGGKLEIHLPFNFKTDIILLKYGVPFQKKSDILKKQVEFEIDTPGVYRLEAYIPGNTFKRLPWIMTNPFFLGTEKGQKGDRQEKQEKEKSEYLNENIPISLADFKIEKNTSSDGSMENRVSEQNEELLYFKFKLEKKSPTTKDFWSVLALRKPFNFSGNTGFSFKVRGNQRCRFWMEFRTGGYNNESWLRHSFLVEKTWKTIKIPFQKFHVYHGDKKMWNVANITAIFFSINNAIAYPGAKGEIFLKDLQIY